MRLTVKTLGWAVISGTIFFASAIVKGCPINAAIVAALIATGCKTPVYPLWEWAFEKLWEHPQG